MGVGSMELYDSQWLTNQESESDPRRGAVSYLQIHHTAYPSTNGARSLMDPGGRTVSANGLLSPEGHLYEVVLIGRRAYTSASSFDHYSLTVETVNTTGGPSWGISQASRFRLAQLAVNMYRAGILGSLTRAHIIGHNEVPGSYATACPGPDMHLDDIVRMANEIFSGKKSEEKPKEEEKEEDMIIQIGTPRTDGGQDYFIVDVGKHTYYSVPNITQVTFNTNVGIKTYINQSPSVIAGYKKL